MLPHQAVEEIGRQEWLEPASDAVQQAVSGVFEAAGPAGQVTKDTLHGVWLGHALHPALTDVPLGAWTVVLALDLLEASGRHDLAPGADMALTVGLVGAVGSALTGVTDWSAINGPARRIGFIHGLLNLGVTTLYAGSLLCRRRGDRAGGRQLALLGYAGSLVSAYLGGHLVYEQRIGVDHVDAAEAPRDFVPVMRLADLPEGRPHRVQAGDVPVVLIRHGNAIQALAETCSHLGGPLAEGRLEDNGIRCPWHGSCFDLASGRIINGPATLPQPRFDARVRDGQVEVRLAPEPLATGPAGGHDFLPASPEDRSGPEVVAH
jgi:nitrite reductase/ring-hydroxylating ferredoxin subunit